MQAREKSGIAREAVSLLHPGASLFIDTGTTALHFARALPKTLDLRIFTNNLRVAMDLFSREGFEVNVFGGTLAQNSPDLVGEQRSYAHRNFASILHFSARTRSIRGAAKFTRRTFLPQIWTRPFSAKRKSSSYSRIAQRLANTVSRSSRD